MTTPHPGARAPRAATAPSITGATTAPRNLARGPLVHQPEPAARLAHILHNAAQELWEICTLDDAAQMWEEARAIASRILASCPGD